MGPVLLEVTTEIVPAAPLTDAGAAAGEAADRLETPIVMEPAELAERLTFTVATGPLAIGLAFNPKMRQL